MFKQIFHSDQPIYFYLCDKSILVHWLLFSFKFSLIKFSELLFSKVDLLSKSKFKVSPMHLITLKR
jgi:hypothetical protein